MTNLSLLSKQRLLALKAHVGAEFVPAAFRLMCATDLWGESDQALRKALWIAEAADAELLLLHVVDGETPLRLTGRRAEHARGALEWRIRRWPTFKPRPAISVRVGNPHRTISRVAREWRADLIVLGPSRPRAMDRFLATTAERVAADARRAVLLVNGGGTAPYRDVTTVATSCCQAAELEQAVDKFQSFLPRQQIKANIGEAAETMLSSSADCVVVQADRWPALSGLFQRNAARLLARSKTTDLLLAPRTSVPGSVPIRCAKHRHL
jgi:nucleotide-binding universal stress UspA family protein